MIDLNIILERMCQVAESDSVKNDKLIDACFNNISDKELIEIIEIAEIIFEKDPNSLTDFQKENCYLYGELLIMFLMVETKNYSLTIQDFKQNEWQELVNNFTDKLCLEYAERMKFINVVISKFFPREYKIKLTQKGKSYLSELNTKIGFSFIDKRLGILMIIFENAANNN